MNIIDSLNHLLHRSYQVDQYTENKATLYGFLKRIGENRERLDANQIGHLLNSIKPLFGALRDNQDQIREKKLMNLSGSWIHQLIYRIKQIAFIFKKKFYGDRGLNHLIDLSKKIAKDYHINTFKVETTRTARFKGIVKKLQKAISKGYCVKDTILLDSSYWPETIGMKVVANSETYAGHFYMGHLAQLKLVNQWSKRRDCRRIAYQQQYSFEDYLNQILIPHYSPAEFADFKEKCSIVEYYTPKELETLAVHFDQEGHVYTRTPHLNAWTANQEMKPQDYYSDFSRQFVLEEDKDLLQIEYPVRDGSLMYVLDHKGQLYLQMKNRGKINHTSLSNGQAVLAAGGLKIAKGKIIEIDTFSGHYRSTEKQLVNLLVYLEKLQIDLDLIQLTYVANYQVQPWIIHHVQRGDVQKWLDGRLGRVRK